MMESNIWYRRVCDLSIKYDKEIAVDRYIGPPANFAAARYIRKSHSWSSKGQYLQSHRMSCMVVIYLHIMIIMVHCVLSGRSPFVYSDVVFCYRLESRLLVFFFSL
ncbi:hypothetical protein O6P43_020963 [Quillaja saponaria]|uniref:Uncharacterized protein n=1 Tax=Quillaja saponaria TaxID=32244 RepID=A0AAD7PLS9_QUISA|nr:hypothetical protein O6P43_020963 [Quillaja saponaria]